jgi:hypothetical protein
LIFNFQCPLSRYLAGGRGPDNISLLKAEAEKLEQLRGYIVIYPSMASNMINILSRLHMRMTGGCRLPRSVMITYRFPRYLELLCEQLSARSILQTLAVIRPDIFLPPLLLRLDSGLDTLTDVAVKCLSSTARSLVRPGPSYRAGPTNVVPLVTAVLPGNDPHKTMMVFQLLSIYAGSSYNPVLAHQIENKGCLLAEIELDFLFTGGRSVQCISKT